MNPNRLKTGSEVWAWFEQNQPTLIPKLEQDRDWLWLIGDLRGDHHRALREQIGSKVGIGFRFSPGGHRLPSGNISHWAHSCEHPTRLKKKGTNGSRNVNRDTLHSTETTDETRTDDSISELLSVL